MKTRQDFVLKLPRKEMFFFPRQKIIYRRNHSGSFSKNLARFSGNFRELKKVKNVKKVVLKWPKIAKKGKKSLRKVQKYHETVKKGPKIVQ